MTFFSPVISTALDVSSETGRPDGHIAVAAEPDWLSEVAEEWRMASTSPAVGFEDRRNYSGVPGVVSYKAPVRGADLSFRALDIPVSFMSRGSYFLNLRTHHF
jgi:hypothetical protein